MLAGKVIGGPAPFGFRRTRRDEAPFGARRPDVESLPWVASRNADATLRKLAAILDDGKVVKAVDALLPR